MTAEAVVYLALGRLLIYLAQKSPYFKKGFLGDLFACDLCLGVWVYSLLSLVFYHVWFIESMPYTPLLSEVLTGSSASMLMWLMTTGFREKFFSPTYIVEDDN